MPLFSATMKFYLISVTMSAWLLACEGGRSSRGTTEMCPERCICHGRSVDCSFRGLTQVPAGVPKITERL